MSFHDFLARHSEAGEFIVLVATCVPAALSTRKLWQEISKTKGIGKTWHWTELVFLWLLPGMVFFSTKAVDWASDDAIRAVQKTANEIHDNLLPVQSSNDLKKDIRSFLAGLNPKTLEMIDSEQSPIAIMVGPTGQACLRAISKRQDFGKYLKVEETGAIGVGQHSSVAGFLNDTEDNGGIGLCFYFTKDLVEHKP
jgi:hypothetical protein